MKLLSFVLPSVLLALPLVSGRSLPRAAAPSNDPFYQPPAGFESTKPGAILRSRSVVASFFGILINPVEAYQLLYRTTAINGSAIATVTTIFKPLVTPRTDRFVSFQTAYDSSASVCDPSYSYQLGTPQSDLISSAEMLIIEIYLALGYIVVSPDYEGPDAAFGPGRLSGMAVLDGIRATSNFHSTLGLSTPNPMVVPVGYSGGAIATGWAASLQPSYAPEIDVKGWVAGGTPANLTGTADFIDGTLFSGFVVGVVDGLLKPSAYGATLQPIVNSIITPTGQAALSFVAANCAIADIIKFADKSIMSTDFQSLGDQLFYEPTVASILAQNTMGVDKSETPTAPVFLYHASQDEVVPYANATTLRSAWCGNGANVKFTTYASGGHVTTEVVAIVEAANFVASAFAGTIESGCSQNTELSSDLNPIALGVELEPILVQLLQVLLVAGDGDSNIVNNVKVLETS
jgi:pimeloyl-ACP methyl ester carboxylesterase